MNILLAGLIVVFYVADVFGLDLSLGPGLSAKNVILNLLALSLAARFMLGSAKIRVELPVLLSAFVVLAVYSLITWIVVSAFFRYPSYNVFLSAVLLKGGIIDQTMLVGLYLYGVNSNREAETQIKTLAAGLAVANAIAIGNAFGLFSIGINMIGDVGEEAGRVFGAFGHANETAALTLCFLPIYVAAARSSNGIARMAWVLGGIVSGALFVLTGSRGGFLALVVGGATATFLCRRYLPVGRVVAWVAIGLAVVLPILMFVEIKFGGVLLDRVTSMILNPGQRGADRTEIWMPAIYRMMESPLSLITGFGWNAYSAMGFYFAAHNQYLLLWFELGLIGLGAYLVIIWQVIGTAQSAAGVAPDRPQSYLLAAVFGMTMLFVAITFTLLTHPWPYIWAYVGLVMKMAVNVISESRQSLLTPADDVQRDVVEPHQVVGAGHDSAQHPAALRHAVKPGPGTRPY